MQKKQNGNALILIFILLFVFCALGFAAWRVVSSTNSRIEQNNGQSQQVDENQALVENAQYVSISGGALSEENLEISIDETVVWKISQPGYSGSVRSLTSSLEVFESGVLIDGRTFAHTFTKPGTFSYEVTSSDGLQRVVGAITVLTPAEQTEETSTAPAAQTSTAEVKTNEQAAEELVAPESCEDYSHTEFGAAAQNFDELKSGLIGSWQGCVKTPWTDPYLVAMTFNEDSTYSAQQKSDNGKAALYYGVDNDSPDKTFIIDDFKSNGTGGGTVTILFEGGATTTSPVSDIQLVGDTLSFSFLHRSQFGPLVFELIRTD